MNLNQLIFTLACAYMAQPVAADADAGDVIACKSVVLGHIVLRFVIDFVTRRDRVPIFQPATRA